MTRSAPPAQPRDLIQSDWSPRNFHSRNADRCLPSRSPFGRDDQTALEQPGSKGTADGMWLGSPQSGLLAPYRQLGSSAQATRPTQPTGNRDRPMRGRGVPPEDHREAPAKLFTPRSHPKRDVLGQSGYAGLSPYEGMAHVRPPMASLAPRSNLTGSSAAVCASSEAPCPQMVLSQQLTHAGSSTAARTMHNGAAGPASGSEDAAGRHRTPRGAAAARVKALLAADGDVPGAAAFQQQVRQLQLGDAQRKSLSFRSRAQPRFGSHKLDTDQVPAPQRNVSIGQDAVASYQDAQRSCALNSLRGWGCPDLLAPCPTAPSSSM